MPMQADEFVPMKLCQWPQVTMHQMILNPHAHLLKYRAETNPGQ